jgi:hypothetical protein
MEPIISSSNSFSDTLNQVRNENNQLLMALESDAIVNDASSVHSCSSDCRNKTGSQINNCKKKDLGMAYDEWLQDLQTKCLRKKKRGRKKQNILQRISKGTFSSKIRVKAREEAEEEKGKGEFPGTNNVQQMTSTSGGGSGLPILFQAQEAQLRRFVQLANEVNYVSNTYTEEFLPGNAFFGLIGQILSSSSNSPSSTTMISMALPPTLVSICRHQENQVYLISNDPNTSTNAIQVQRFKSKDQFFKQEQKFLSLFCPPNSNSNSAGNSKTKSFYKVSTFQSLVSKGNDLRSIEKPEECSEILQDIWKYRENSFRVLQKKIPCKGLTKAWIVRSVWQKKKSSISSFVWILTADTSSENTSTKLPSNDDENATPSCHIVKSSGPNAWTEPRSIVNDFVLSLETILKISFKEFVADFIQDLNGKWWFLQVKAFKIRPRAHSAPAPLASSATATTSATVTTALGSTFKCTGLYCSSPVNSDEKKIEKEEENCTLKQKPAGFLSYKEMLICQFLEVYTSQKDMSITGGHSTFSGALDFFLLNVSRKERNLFYNRIPLCQACIQKYTRLREILQKTIEQEKNKPMTTSLATVTKVSSIPKKMLAPIAMTSPVHHEQDNGGLNIQEVRRQLGTSKSMILCPLKIHQENQKKEEENDLKTLEQRAAKALNVSIGGKSKTEQQMKYLKELEEIEKILQQNEERSGLKLSSVKSLPALATPASSSKLDQLQVFSQEEQASLDKINRNNLEPIDYSRFFTQDDRIEEMWKTLDIAPISTTTTNSTREGGPKYNTFCLSTMTENTSALKAQLPIAPHKSPVEEQPVVSARLLTNIMVPSDAATPHVIRIYDCKRVFYEDEYRESLTQDAKQYLKSLGWVRLVVFPKENEILDPEVAEMVLRTLYLDIDGLRIMPLIELEASSGCRSMMIPPFSSTQ